MEEQKTKKQLSGHVWYIDQGKNFKIYIKSPEQDEKAENKMGKNHLTQWKKTIDDIKGLYK